MVFDTVKNTKHKKTVTKQHKIDAKKGYYTITLIRTSLLENYLWHDMPIRSYNSLNMLQDKNIKKKHKTQYEIKLKI